MVLLCREVSGLVRLRVSKNLRFCPQLAIEFGLSSSFLGFGLLGCKLL